MTICLRRDGRFFEGRFGRAAQPLNEKSAGSSVHRSPDAPDRFTQVHEFVVHLPNVNFTRALRLGVICHRRHARDAPKRSITGQKRAQALERPFSHRVVRFFRQELNRLFISILLAVPDRNFERLQLLILSDLVVLSHQRPCGFSSTQVEPGAWGLRRGLGAARPPKSAADIAQRQCQQRFGDGNQELGLKSPFALPLEAPPPN